MLFGLLLITTRFNEPDIKFNISSSSVPLKVFKSMTFWEEKITLGVL